MGLQLLLLVVVPFFIFLLQQFLFVKLPPGPSLLQLWRRRSQFTKQPHVAFNELAKTYGPLLSLRLGSQLVVVASSPAMAKEIHKTNNQFFAGRHFPSIYYNIPGAVQASTLASRDCDDTWKFLRGIGQNYIYSSKAIESFAPIRKAKVTEMVEFLRTNEKVVNIECVVYATLINIVGNVMMSRDLCETGGDGESYEKVTGFLTKLIKKAMVPGSSDMFPILKWIDFWTKGKSMEIYQDLVLFWGDIIDERKASHDVNSNSEQDFLKVLIGYSFNNDQIRIILTELLSAGTETTLVSAMWLMAELIKNPKTIEKLRDEITETAIEGEELNESLLSECVYLHACIKESFRLHNPGPFGVPHRALKTCKVNNHTIPKDSIVLVNSWAIQRDRYVWEDAASFKPQRFLDSIVGYRGAHFELLPFGAGTRICPGINVAIKSLQLVVASLVHYFDWSLPDGKDPTQLHTTEMLETSLRMENPLYLIPIPRGKSLTD